MNEEFRNQWNTDIDARVAKYLTELHEKLRMLSKAHGIRNVEDWCIKRMAELLGIRDGKITSADVVERFLQSFAFSEITRVDIESLEESEMANTTINIKYRTDRAEDMVTTWKFLRPSLEGADASRYERFYKFCTGATPTYPNKLVQPSHSFLRNVFISTQRFT